MVLNNTMMKSKKQLIIIVLTIIAVSGAVFYFWDKSSVSFLDVKSLGLSCEVERTCNGIIGVDCNSDVDGPYYYIDEKTGQIISKCGGYCEVGCTNCPPKEWSCEM